MIEKIIKYIVKIIIKIAETIDKYIELFTIIAILFCLSPIIITILEKVIK